LAKLEDIINNKAGKYLFDKELENVLKRRNFNIDNPRNQSLIDTVEFSCEVLEDGKECVSKAQYRETTTEINTNRNADLYLCSNHFFNFKEYWEPNKPHGNRQGISINKPKIKARRNIEWKRFLKKNKPFDLRSLK
jgi:hypothetical protein